MKGRFAGLVYSMSTSESPIVVLHRDVLTSKELLKFSSLFPRGVRVEFQQVNYDNEDYIQYGRGDYILYDKSIPLIDVKNEKQKQENLIKKMREDENNTPCVYYEMPKELK